MSKVKSAILPMIGVVAGVLMVIIGALGIVSAIREILQNLPSVEIGRQYDRRALHSLEGVVVDSRGNIYYGLGLVPLSRAGSIQVHNSEGDFLYNISFPTWTGTFFFYVDSDDVLHVFPVRNDRVLSFRHGELIDSRRHNSNMDRNATINRMRYHQQQTEFTDIHGNRYVLSSSVNFRMYDSYGNFIRTIRPDAPMLPLPFLLSLFVSAAGVGITILTIRHFIPIRRKY